MIAVVVAEVAAQSVVPTVAEGTDCGIATVVVVGFVGALAMAVAETDVFVVAVAAALVGEEDTPVVAQE